MESVHVLSLFDWVERDRPVDFPGFERSCEGQSTRGVVIKDVLHLQRKPIPIIRKKPQVGFLSHNFIVR